MVVTEDELRVHKDSPALETVLAVRWLHILDIQQLNEAAPFLEDKVAVDSNHIRVVSDEDVGSAGRFSVVPTQIGGRSL